MTRVEDLSNPGDFGPSGPGGGVDKVLSREMELAHVTLGAINEGVIRTDAEGRVDFMNPAAETMTGWTLAQAMGRDLAEVYQVFQEVSQSVPRRPRRDPVTACLAEKRSIVPPGLYILRSRNDEELVIRDSVSPLLVDGQVLGTAVVFRDLTRVRVLERDVIYLSSHDTLTSLLNRQEFEIHLEAALEVARDHDQSSVLLYLDLWEFKLINDCYGLVAGDELLRQVARIFRSQVGEKDFLARLGGDNFAILLSEMEIEAARDLARELRRALRDFRFTWGGQSLEVGLCIGMVPITAASESVSHLLKAADAASYLAKRSGRNKIHAYLPGNAEVAERYGRFHWVQRIRHSLAEDRFCLYHQQIQPLHENGLPPLHEILVRLVGDDGEHIPPGDFIPVAEDHDLAPLLDRWIVRQVLQRLANDGDILSGAPVSINLSGHSLSDESFVDDLTSYLRASPVSPERLYFEITETAAVAHLTRALDLITNLKDMGCRFILDDFGSGFSSFSYLRNLPVDILKIDGDFVRTMESDRIRQAMVSSIHQIGHVMGLQTIAEWVETERTYEMLRELKVDYAQGFWVHRPEELI